MNQFTPDVYDELVSRLALGIEAVDAGLAQPVVDGVALVPDAPFGLRKSFQRRSGGRFALLHDEASAVVAQTVSLRLVNAAGASRRYVPRRLKFAVPGLAAAEALPPARRGCRPRLFPGAAYPVSGGATGLRGQVFRMAGGRHPLRWVRVVATIPAAEFDLDAASVVGRAFGDDRGEFLLLIAPGAASGTPSAALTIRVSIFGRAAAPPPPANGTDDALWDAPLEQPASTDDADPVLLGSAVPADWGLLAFRILSVRLGRLDESAPAFEI